MILNLGCGASRPKDKDWINVDDLHSIFPNADCPERKHMDAEPNYKNFDLRQPLWVADNSVDGILASHFLEHLGLQDAVKTVKNWYRVLRPGGVVRLSTPDPHKFWTIQMEGKEDWGEPNYSLQGDHPTTFIEYALFFPGHLQVVGKDTAFCLLYVAGFRNIVEMPFGQSNLNGLGKIDNRPKFSSFIEGIK